MSPLLTLLNPHDAERYYAEGHWRADTLYALLAKHAAARPHAYALRDGRLRLVWRELAEWVDAVAESLYRAGLRRGERVAVWLPSRAEGVVCLLACSRNGYVCVPSLHQNYTVAEIVQLLERSRSRALVMQAGYGADAKRARGARPSPAGRISREPAEASPP